MSAYDPRIDAYIAKSSSFAQPVLEHLRALVHEVCPLAEETIKWGMPSFGYKGILCGMGAFKHHCTFGFWKTALMADPHGAMKNKEDTSMGSFGRITSLKDLPADEILKSLILEAIKLNEEGIKAPARQGAKKKPQSETETPDFIIAALKENPAAHNVWEAFAASHRREYIEWITEAKTQPTREKRMAQMLEWVAGGKGRNWKYQKHQA